MNPFVGDDVAPQAEVFVLLGVLLGTLSCGFIVLFIGGEILSDPGGAQGAQIVAMWLGLPIILAALAFIRPKVAYPILIGVVALVLLASVTTIPWAEQVWEFEDTHGPIALMVLVGALIPLVVLGRSRPRRAGLLMITLIGGFLMSQAVSLSLVDQWSVILLFGVLMSPFIAVAVLLILGGTGNQAIARGTSVQDSST